MSVTAYNIYVGWTAIRDRIYRVLPTAILKRIHDRAYWLEHSYQAGRPHTDDQYDRVADRAVTLDAILEGRRS